MFTTDFRRQIAAIVCTVLMSTACVLSAVEPAQVDGAARHAAVTRPVA